MRAEATSGSRPSPVREPGTAAYAAFSWSIVFLIPHLYWAAGGTAGLDGDAITGVLAAINYLAMGFSIAAGALALALVRAWGALLPRRLLLTGAWAACVILSLRGGGGLLQTLVVALGQSDDDVPTLALVFEPLFLVGGILFGLAAREYGRATR
ncbi:MAG: DUF3995 domain-containing protein [Gaiellaceae bacterium MAG52_C11]|nr:DUF3995 domain-containing protein [Candidatus Gaiellasilicea maunaloa]